MVDIHPFKKYNTRRKKKCMKTLTFTVDALLTAAFHW